MDLFSLLPVFGVWVFSLTQLGLALTAPEIIGFAVFLIAGYLFYFSLFLIASALAFWTITGQGAGRFLEGVLKLAAFPPDILGQPLNALFSYILPVALIAVVPAQVLLGLISPPVMAISLILIAVWLGLARWLWQTGLKHYSSASS